MVPLAVSSDECLEALERAGFRVLSRNDTESVVGDSSSRSVVVPRASVLEPAVIARVLRDAAISGTEFLELLSSPSAPRVRSPYASGVRARYVRQTG
jgi:hypothetical protein